MGLNQYDSHEQWTGSGQLIIYFQNDFKSNPMKQMIIACTCTVHNTHTFFACNKLCHEKPNCRPFPSLIFSHFMTQSHIFSFIHFFMCTKPPNSRTLNGTEWKTIMQQVCVPMYTSGVEGTYFSYFNVLCKRKICVQRYIRDRVFVSLFVWNSINHNWAICLVYNTTRIAREKQNIVCCSFPHICTK